MHNLCTGRKGRAQLPGGPEQQFERRGGARAEDTAGAEGEGGGAAGEGLREWAGWPHHAL
eukprot:3569018-Lingulodinium_polyedra.AAC.1